MITGQVDLTVQAAEFTQDGGMTDGWVARELGRAYAERLDVEILSGTDGLLNASGVTEITYTDATPTQPEMWPKLMQLVSETGDALGAPPDVALLHPRRLAWLANWRDTAGLPAHPEWPFGMQVVPVPAMPTNRGAGTNEDAAVVLRRDEVILYLSQPKTRVIADFADSNKLVLRVQALGWMALASTRMPEAIGKRHRQGSPHPSWT